MAIEFVSNPELKIIKPGYPGNKKIDGQFANGDKLYHPSYLRVLEWKITTNPQKNEKNQDKYCPRVLQNHSLFIDQQDGITWIGHATFLIRLRGITFITDPILFDLPFIKRRPPLPCPPDAFRNIDYVLLSHGHRDHLDEKSLQLIYRQNPQLKAFVPLAMGNLLESMAPGLPYQEAGWYQQFALPLHPGIELFYLPASHWHRRGLTDMNKVLWGSFLLHTPEKSIYFAGDSSYDTHYTDIKELFGSPDICLLPVGAYKPAFLMHNSHMDPFEAIQAFDDIGGKSLIPMHYGTFDLSDEPPGEPPRILEQMATANKLSGRLIMPAIGETIPIS